MGMFVLREYSERLLRLLLFVVLIFSRGVCSNLEQGGRVKGEGINMRDICGQGEGREE